LHADYIVLSKTGDVSLEYVDTVCKKLKDIKAGVEIFCSEWSTGLFNIICDKVLLEGPNKPEAAVRRMGNGSKLNSRSKFQNISVNIRNAVDEIQIKQMIETILTATYQRLSIISTDFILRLRGTELWLMP